MSPLHVAAVKGRDECLRIMLEPTTPGGKCTVDLDIKNKVAITTCSHVTLCAYG